MNYKERYKTDIEFRNRCINNARNYRKKYPDRKSTQNKIYKINHKEEEKKYMNSYFKNNPEKFLEYSRKHYEVYGTILNMSWKDYKWALQAWSNTVRKRDRYMCQTCPNKAEVAHHIFHKSKYPELSLNINNGISLCKKCHKQVHGIGLT